MPYRPMPRWSGQTLVAYVAFVAGQRSRNLRELAGSEGLGYGDAGGGGEDHAEAGPGVGRQPNVGNVRFSRGQGWPCRVGYSGRSWSGFIGCGCRRRCQDDVRSRRRRTPRRATAEAVCSHQAGIAFLRTSPVGSPPGGGSIRRFWPGAPGRKRLPNSERKR